MSGHPHLSIVVPVYNSAATVQALAKQITAALAKAPWPFEIILVNDGSRDESWNEIVSAAGKYPSILGINLMRNYGQHNALLAGIQHAQGKVIVTMDDDLQHPPAEIDKLLTTLEQGSDVVYGVPEQERHGLWRDLASRISKLALRIVMRIEIADQTSAFRAFRSQAIQAHMQFNGPFVDIDALLAWGTSRFATVSVRHMERRDGVSNYTFFSLVSHALKMVTAFSTLPLRVATVTGFAFMIFSVGVLAWVVGRYLIEGESVPGFPFLASIIGLFSGAQLFAMGIMGEYLAKIHLRSMGRPAAVVRERTRAPRDP
ncbi:MAG: glycosyltransferase family 2 protein [Burkholderiales bacterium]